VPTLICHVASVAATHLLVRTGSDGGEYWFLRQLVRHRWRVRDPADADLLVIPSLFSFQVPRGRAGGIKPQYCKGLTPITSIMAAIGRTETWRSRQHDHVRVSLDWEYACLPGAPATWRNATLRAHTAISGADEQDGGLTGAHRDDAVRRASLTTCMAGAGYHEPMLRGFVESHVRSAPRSTADAATC
jgi:hypothetical protein